MINLKYHKYKLKNIELKNIELKNLHIGGALSKQATRDLINKLPKSSINDIGLAYYGIDEENYRFIEVPQGRIYEYNGEDVIDLKNKEIIYSGTNAILYIIGMGPCCGLIIQEEHRIMMGHLDEIDSFGFGLTINILTESLSGNPLNIYYIMGMCSFDSLLNDGCTLDDISSYVLNIVQKRNLEGKINIIEDFYGCFTSKIGYDFENGNVIVFPITPTIRDRFITEQDYEDEEFERHMNEDICDDIRKNVVKYNYAKENCMKCGFNIKSTGKSTFLCSDKK